MFAAPEADNGEHYRANAATIKDLIAGAKGCAVIDGGLATELERRGADINDPLWSAKCLLDKRLCGLIREVHLDYLRAGADIIISASYQATIQGFASRGIGEAEAEKLLRRSVVLALDARDQFWSEYLLAQERQGVHASNGARRQRPLVAASVGSYGAFLADGSEYSGDYGPAVTVETLMDFHRRRMEVLSDAGADVLAIETIPSLQEGQAFVRLLEEGVVRAPAWLAFNSKDGRHVVRGDAFEECARLGERCERVVAVGINCTPPRFIHGLISRVRQPVCFVDHPHATVQEATGVSDTDFVAYTPTWREAGANLIGGCCRTTPHTIRSICHALQVEEAQPQPQAN
eukprot:jgi/Mesen1/9230/ME000595S08639